MTNTLLRKASADFLLFLYKFDGPRVWEQINDSINFYDKVYQRDYKAMSRVKHKMLILRLFIYYRLLFLKF